MLARVQGVDELKDVAPGGIHGVLLLARILHKSDFREQAVEIYRHCHRLDQSMWVAFQVRYASAQCAGSFANNGSVVQRRASSCSGIV